MKILDATASVRSIWYQKKYKDTVFFDKRNGKYYENHDAGEHLIKPNVQGAWMNLPFIDNCFDMVIFDPPHIIRSNKIKPSQISARYGIFHHDTWKHEMEQGIKELFRVLAPNGTFIFKWCECDKPIDEILKLFPYSAVFGTKTGTANNNHWIVFFKNREEKQLSDFFNS